MRARRRATFAGERLDRLECGAPQACDVEPVLSRRVLLLARRALKAAGPAYPPLTGAAGSCDERAAAASRRPRCRRDGCHLGGCDDDELTPKQARACRGWWAGAEVRHVEA